MSEMLLHEDRVQLPTTTQVEVAAELPAVDVVGKPGKYCRTFSPKWLLSGVVLIVLAALGWHIHHRAIGDTKEEIQAGTSGGKATLGPARGVANAGVEGEEHTKADVETVGVEVIPRGNTLQLTGTLTADETSSVASNITGIVSEIRVDRGSVVKKGDLLIQLDPTDAQNRLAEGIALVDELEARLVLKKDAAEPFVVDEQPQVKLAKAARNLADSRLRRNERLVGKGAVSVDDFEATKAEREFAEQRCEQSMRDARHAYQSYKTAIVRLAVLRKAVADTKILAPFDGVVAEKCVNVREQIVAGFMISKIITLVKTDPLRISLTVPQQAISHIQPGQVVQFHVDSFPDRAFSATVRFISPIVTNDTRSMVVEAVAPNPDGVLRPGLFATAELKLLQQQPGTIVPAGAVQRSGEVAKVFAVREGVVRELVVALGKTDQGKAEILSGLTGQEILVAHPERVHDGDRVR